MVKAKARDPSGRDLVFEQWYADNIVPVRSGGALEESAIYKAYKRDVAPGITLGRQGVHRMLNQLGVKRSVRVGKPMRLNVGFKPVVKAAVATVAVAGVTSADEARAIGRAQMARDMAKLDEPPGLARVMFEGVNFRNAVVSEPGADMTSLAVMAEVYAERRRQREEEGFDAAHDDASDPGAHERAAACYAYAAGQADHLAPFVDFTTKAAPREGRLGWVVRDTLVMMWPWSVLWWKPKTDAPDWKRRCLVRAGALILAAIERLDREAARDALADSQRSQMTGV